jgi:cytochrome c oxidase subunit 3
MSHITQLKGAEKWKGGVLPFQVNYGKLMMWFFLVSDALTFTAFLVAYGFNRYHHEGVWPKAENVFTHFPFLHGDHPLLYVALMTLILIMSSVTMVLAVESGQRNVKKGVIKWLVLTIIGGIIFLGSQAWEWSHFIHGTHEGALKMGIGSYTMPDGTVENTQGQVAQWADEAKTSIILPFKNEGKPIELSGAEAQKIIANGTPIHGANLKENEYGPTLFGNFFFFITGFHGTHVLSGVILNIIVLIMVLKGVFERKGNYEMVEKVGLYWHFVDLVWVFVFTFFYLI